MRIFFDQLHGVKDNSISLVDALELMVFCNHEGQVDQKSEFETRLYDELCTKITDEINDPHQLSLIWLLLRSWGPSGKDFNQTQVRILLCASYNVGSVITYESQPNLIYVFEVTVQAHSKISERFNEEHLRCAVSEIIIGPKNHSNDVLLVIQKLRRQLERSSTEIFPFFEACSRKAHQIGRKSIQI